MHLIRRSASRLAASKSTSFLSISRSITNSSPFTIRVKPQTTFSAITRRFASNDVEAEDRESEIRSSPSSSDSENQSSIASAISSASEYASDAAENFSNRVSAARNTVVDTASRYANKSGFDPDRPRILPALKPNNAVYVGNFSFDVTEEELKEPFSSCGEITHVTIAKDYRNLSKGFGYVTFNSLEASAKAIKTLDGSMFRGRRIVVNYQARGNVAAGTATPSKTLFLGNLPYEMSDEDLNALFRDINNVLDVRVAIDRRTGQPRGFAHADFVDVAAATKAMEMLQGKHYYGRTLRIDFAGSRRVESQNY